MENKRRYPRFSVDLMQFGGRMLRATEVVLFRMKPDEVKLKADIRLELKREYSIKLKDTANEVTLRGTVIRSTLSGTKKGEGEDVIPKYTAVLKLKEVTDDLQTKLEGFINAHLEETEHRLSVLTLKADETAKVLLDCPVEYRVKMISLGGMLIETRQPAEIEQLLPMEMSLPGGHTYKFQGRVASCRMIPENAEFFDIGIEFRDMPEKDKEKLKEFISSLGNP